MEYPDKYREFVITWIQKSIESKSWEKFDDLHIDEINSEFQSQAVWIEAGLLIYNLILENLKNSPYDCFWAIQLDYSSKKTKTENLDINYLKEHLDLTPPSFYIFPKGDANYEQTIKESKYVEKISRDVGHSVFFREELENSREYFRCIYIKGDNN